MIRLLITLFGLTLMLISVSIFLTISANSPALNKAARIEGLYGDWRVPDGPALYDRSDYLFQLGYGFAHADAVVSSATVDQQELASIELSRQRAETAIKLLVDSISLAPGNALAWDSLAWSYFLVGDFDNSMNALSATWALAPNNFSLALSRLPLIDLIGEIDDVIVAVEGEILENVAGDLKTLAYFEPAAFETAITNSDILRKFAKQGATN